MLFQSFICDQDGEWLLLLSQQHNMEVTLCAQEASDHAVLLLAHLNLQRKEDRFCDCVLRHRDHPGQLHPAHRCVVAASSPVLASLLSSTGVLVELQAPCFSDSILAAVLDYMYTGTLPHAQSQQQHSCLLSAACYLQMDKLREVLENWRQSEGIPAENESSNSTEDEHQPLTDNIAWKKAVTTDRNILPLNSSKKAFRGPEETDASRLQSTGTFHEVEVKSVADSFRKNEETDASETQARLTEAQRGSPSLTHACYEPVSVIRHSRGGTIFKWAEMSSVPPSLSPTFLTSSRVPIPQTANRYNDRTTGGITSEYKNPCASQNQDGKSQAVMQYKESLQSSTKHFRDEKVQQEKDPILVNIPSKYRKWKSFETYHGSMATTTERHSQDLRDAFPLHRKDSNSGSETQDKDPCPEENVMNDHSYSSSCLAERDQQESQSNIYRHQKNCLPKIWMTESSPTDVDDRGQSDMSTPGSSQDNITGHLSPFECDTALETEKMSGTESTEPHLSFTMSHNDTIFTDVGETYHGHLHDQRVSEDNPHISYGGLEHKPFQTGFHHSEKDEEEVGVNTKSGPDHQGVHLATDTTDQVLLLDISTKSAQLVVSCRRTSDTEQTDIWDTGPMTTEGGNGSRPGVQVIENAETAELISNPQEGENQISTQAVGSPSSVSDATPASSSVCLPFTLSTSMPANISTHLSTPVKHPFQCRLCDRSFSQRGSLNRHLRSHLGVRPFSCPYCPMTFSRQYRVSEHIRVHQRCSIGNIFPKNPTTTV